MGTSSVAAGHRRTAALAPLGAGASRVTATLMTATLMTATLMTATLMTAIAMFGCATAATPDSRAPTPRAVCPGGRIAVDREAREFGGCATIEGDLQIYGPALTSLAPLVSLESVRGDLIIGPTASLRTLTGLERLRVVTGTLRVEETMRLASAALPGLREVGGSLRVENNYDLALVRAPQLERVRGDLVVEANDRLVGAEFGEATTVDGDRSVQSETDAEPDTDA